jgi:hypothetical protein
MALLSTTGENQALNSLDASGTPTNIQAFTTLHSASPGTTGANEMSGSGYARQAMTWNAASSGSKTNSTSLTFSTNGTTPVTHFDGNSASSAGTWGLGGALTSSVTAASITAASGALTLSAS